MWMAEHSIETDAPPEAIWRLWADVPGWPEWNADLLRAKLVGSFVAGSRIRMTSRDGDSVDLRIADANPPERFVDEADLGGVLVRTTHHIERIDARRIRVVYRMEISGPEADTLGPQLGPEITSDFHETLAALVELAERR